MDLGHLKRGHYGAIYADPPWRYVAWSAKGTGRSAEQHYDTMSADDLKALPVGDLAAKDCVLFMWATWPCLLQALALIEAWGFTYKTIGFDWMKADARQLELFQDDIEADMKLGHWTRSNAEPCLLATRGSPTRLDAGVRMGIIEPTRGHSRKPDCAYERIERLVAGPYLELFARRTRPNWVSVGNEVNKFDGQHAPMHRLQAGVPSNEGELSAAQTVQGGAQFGMPLVPQQQDTALEKAEPDAPPGQEAGPLQG